MNEDCPVCLPARAAFTSFRTRSIRSSRSNRSTRSTSRLKNDRIVGRIAMKSRMPHAEKMKPHLLRTAKIVAAYSRKKMKRKKLSM